MRSILLAAAPLASLVSASFDGNLNYNSPSRRHEGLGIDVAKVAKRTLIKRATPWDPAQLNFTHGVASGDPYPDSIILWTRIAPSLENDRSNVTVSGHAAFYNHETEKYIDASPNPICVEYRVGTDRNFSSVSDHGTAYTTSDIDFTVKVSSMYPAEAYKLTSKRLKQRTWLHSCNTITSSTCVAAATRAHSEEQRQAPTTTTTFPK
jgi:alkaline phosphatase D